MRTKTIYLTMILLFLFTGMVSCLKKNDNYIMSKEERERLEKEADNRPNEIWPTNRNQRGEYYYRVNLCSFPDYYSRNAGSYFIAGRERITFVDIENEEWPQTTDAGRNKEYHPMPDSLHIRWLSIPENKFYGGTITMPTAKLTDYFNQMWSANAPNRKAIQADKFERYEDIIVGVAPLGVVVVWISSGHQQIEIGRFQVEEIQLEWEKFAGSNGHGAGSTRDSFISNSNNTAPVPIGKADAYREKFIWNFKLEATADAQLTRIKLLMFNGEVESFYHEYKEENVPEKRAVPKKFYCIWNEKDKHRYRVIEITLDEEDIYKAFHTICKKPTTVAELVYITDKQDEVTKLVLRNETHEYVLDPIDISESSGEIDDRIIPMNENK